MSHSLLIVTHSFPPASSPAAIRMLRFTRHLIELGWQVHVLCPYPQRTYYPRQDETLLDEIPPEAVVHRMWVWDLSREQQVARAQQRTPGRQGANGKGRVLELAKALKKWFLYPDVYVTWAPSLFWHGVRLCRRHRFSAILATGDPWSVVVMASRLATWAGVPFVADFRELWSGHSHRTNQQEIARFGESEQKVFERADLILANSPLEREILEASCKAVHPPRFISVENGFEVDELMAAAGSCSKLPAEPFIITYAGSFGYRKPDAFFAGLSAWLAQAPALKEKVRVKVAGPLEPRVIEMVAELGLEGVVEFLGYLPHHEVLDLLYSSHLLLAIVGTATNQDFDPTVPAKMYEYAATGRPVLLLAKPGGATRFFETVGGYGAWVDNESPSQITQALGDLYARYQDVGLPHQCNLEVGEYTYAAATRRLSDALLRILVHGQVVSS